MHRIDGDGHASNTFTEGDPGIPTPATQVTDDWLNDVQENLCEAIEGVGLTLSKGDYFQLLQAMVLAGQGATPGGRLTLTTGVAVDGNEVASAGTVYYTPHRSNRIVLYDGTRWVGKAFVEMSQATTDATKSPAACANNSNYDVFVWDDSGTLRATRGPAWSSDTARGTGAGTTELEFFDGRWVNKVAVANGPAARRGLYVGTVRTDGAAVVNDTLAKRHVWNMYNRVERALAVIEATTSWNYTTDTLRQANGAATNQLDVVVGLAEDSMRARVLAHAANSNGNNYVRVGIGLDSTTTNTATTLASSTNAGGAGFVVPVGADWVGYPGLGRHYLVWLEAAAAIGTTTWYSGSGGSLTQSGLIGTCVA